MHPLHKVISSFRSSIGLVSPLYLYLLEHSYKPLKLDTIWREESLSGLGLCQGKIMLKHGRTLLKRLRRGFDIPTVFVTESFGLFIYFFLLDLGGGVGKLCFLFCYVVVVFPVSIHNGCNR